MCSTSTEMIFCSCDDMLGGNEKTGEYTWSLTRYVGRSKSIRLGKILKPSEDLGNAITIERVLKEMNSRHCFDFDYTPQENDSLRIRNGQKGEAYKYLTIVYTDNTWIAGSNGTFGVIKKTINRGVVEQRPNKK